MFGEVEGVVVTVPGEDAAVAEFGGEFERRVVVDSDGERCAALVETRRIGDAVDFEAGNCFEACDRAIEKTALVLVNRFVGGFDRGAAVGLEAACIGSIVPTLRKAPFDFAQGRTSVYFPSHG